MSLTSLLKNDIEWKTFFKINSPKKTEFMTVSGVCAFSNEYTCKAEYNLSKNTYSSVLGTAFDYLARFIVAKIVVLNRNTVLTNLIAELGLKICIPAAKKEGIDIEAIYVSSINKCNNYIYSETGLSEIINIAIFLAKLEQLYRSCAQPFNVNINYLLNEELEIYTDLYQLCKIFKSVFIDNKIIKKNSIVVYNPTFGGASELVCGADADIYIDGTLYDLKCTKNSGYSWTDSAQIFGYFLLDQISKKNNDANCLNGHEIKRIAFYKARFGEIEYVEVSRKKYQSEIKEFEKILGIIKYKKYLERKNKEKEIDDLYTEYWTNPKKSIKLDNKKIMTIIKEKNICIEDIAFQTNRTPNTVKKWIKGTSSPNIYTFIKLIKILDCYKSDIALK